MVKKVSVLVILIAAIGFFAWNALFVDQTGTVNSITKGTNTEKPMTGGSVSPQNASSVVVPAPTIASASPPPDTTASAASAKAAGGYFYHLDGDISIIAGHEAARLATKNDKIVSGMTINVGDKSHAVLIFDDDQIVFMQPNSSFEVRDYHYDTKQTGNNNVDFAINQGGLRLITGKIGQKNHKAFKLKTPNGTIDIRGTEFSVVVDKDKKSVYSHVESGGIALTNSAGTTETAAGQYAVTASPSSPAAVIPAAAVPAKTFKPLTTLVKKTGPINVAKAKAAREPQLKKKVAKKSTPAKQADVTIAEKAAVPVSDSVEAVKPATASIAIADDRKADGNEVTVKARGGYFYAVEGDVYIKVGNADVRHVVKYDSVPTGSSILTGDQSSAVLKFEDGQVVAMQAGSAMLVREYNYEPEHAERNNIVFSMLNGGMHLITGQIGHLNPDAFRLATPQATIGILGTDFMVVIKNGQAFIKVLSGSVTLTNAAGTLVLTAGQTALVVSERVAPVIAAVSEDTFSGVTAINLEKALAAASTAPAAPAAPVASAGGAVRGGAAAATTTVTAASGVSGSAIAIGLGVAAGVAALVSTTATSHH